MKIVRKDNIPSNLPRSMCQGELTFGDVGAPCHVLDDAARTRVLTRRGVACVLLGSKTAYFGQFFERIRSNFPDVDLGAVIEFSIPGAPNGVGIEAERFADLCGAIAKAFGDGALHEKQFELGRRSLAITVGLARRGIEALVDEATGFQKLRAASDLQTKFEAYLREELAPWERVFPPSFYVELARVYRQKLGEGSRRPVFMAQFTRRFVYEALDPDVAHELAARIASPEHGNNYHQLLSDRARAVLVRHVDRLHAVLRQSDSPDDFRMRFACEFRGGPLQYSLRVA